MKNPSGKERIIVMMLAVVVGAFFLTSCSKKLINKPIAAITNAEMAAALAARKSVIIVTVKEVEIKNSGMITEVAYYTLELKKTLAGSSFPSEIKAAHHTHDANVILRQGDRYLAIISQKGPFGTTLNLGPVMPCQLNQEADILAGFPELFPTK